MDHVADRETGLCVRCGHNADCRSACAGYTNTLPKREVLHEGLKHNVMPSWLPEWETWR